MRQHRLRHARQLLRRLFQNKDGLLRVLEGPKFRSTPTLPKTTSAPSSPKEKFPAELSAKKAATRDIMSGRAKTCMKLKLSFYDFIGDRLGIPGPKIPPLAGLIRQAPA